LLYALAILYETSPVSFSIKLAVFLASGWAETRNPQHATHNTQKQ